MAEKRSKTPALSAHLESVKVQVARIEERQVSMDEKQDVIASDVSSILLRLCEQQKSIEKYKNDRNWVVGIFGVLYAGMLAWIESWRG